MSSSANIVDPIRDKPHGPETTLGQRVLGPLYVTGIFWYRMQYWLTFAPEWFIRFGTFVSTWFFWFWLWRIRSNVARNLEAVLGPCGFFERQRRIWRTFYDFAWCMHERYEQFRSDRPMHFDFEGASTEAQMRASDSGLVIFTAHFGNWEMGPLVPGVPRERKIHVVREPEMSRPAQRFVQGLFDRHPMRDMFVVHYAGSDLALGARLLMALRQGDIIALPGDRPRAGMRSLRSRMFGRPMDLPPGPAALARAAEVPLVPVFVFREGRRQYRIVLREPFLVARSGEKDRDIEAAVEHIADECEWAIRQRPHHWFCWARLW